MVSATTYLMRAAGETLIAETLEELAELVELALAHDDDPSTFRARDASADELRLLERDEFEALLALVRDRPAYVRRSTFRGNLRSG